MFPIPPRDLAEEIATLGLVPAAGFILEKKKFEEYDAFLVLFRFGYYGVRSEILSHWNL